MSSPTVKGDFGLSPRVRGNPADTVVRFSRRRSIPARTGEPAASVTLTVDDAVYPRAYGGTAHHSSKARRQLGLSPRVRGNPSAIRSASSR